MSPLNPAYVLAPFQELIARCQNNVLLGLRVVERVNELPPPTSEEYEFFQISFGSLDVDLENSREEFKRWILLNGFSDIHAAIRLGLERTLVFEKVRERLPHNPASSTTEFAREVHEKAARMHFPQLIAAVNSLYDEPFRYLRHVESYNNARNCLEHAGGIVTSRHCNNPEKNKMVIYGDRFKPFFAKGSQKIPAKLGTLGPENAALMLGAEEFDIEFRIGSPINLSLKDFVDVLNTCVFISANIGSKLRG